MLLQGTPKSRFVGSGDRQVSRFAVIVSRFAVIVSRETSYSL